MALGPIGRTDRPWWALAVAALAAALASSSLASSDRPLARVTATGRATAPEVLESLASPIDPATITRRLTAPIAAQAPRPLASSAPPRRLLIADAAGRTLVAREYARLGDRTAALLPDGSIGWPNAAIETDQAFRPWTAAELRHELLAGPYRDFEPIEEAHYLVLTAGSEGFARDSARLLESLYRGLLESFGAQGFAVREAEFPLVAVIFATEAEFRARTHAAAEVQALYDVGSNRIFLYEKADRDRRSPELAALRRPQAVAHEGTHQVLQNIGVQPRLADWPAWLVEGLADYCAPTATTKTGEWARFGVVNPLHMATIAELNDTIALRRQLGGLDPSLFGLDTRRPWIETIVARDELEPTDYALAWALVHYLATHRYTEFRDYLMRMGRLAPLVPRSPEVQLAEFRSSFRRRPRELDRLVVSHLGRLRGYEPLPFYAVGFRQPLADGSEYRLTLVSQSPSVIARWVDLVGMVDGGPPRVDVAPYASRERAFRAVATWLDQP